MGIYAYSFWFIYKFYIIVPYTTRRNDMSIYNFSARRMNGQEVSLEKYKGEVLVIVNTASKCGFTEAV